MIRVGSSFIQAWDWHCQNVNSGRAAALGGYIDGIWLLLMLRGDK